jgi:large subunit ribosomal protein L5
MAYTPNLKAKYNDEIVPALKEKFAYKSVMQVPKLTKIILSQGVGKGTTDKKLVENAVNEMTMIAGQKAYATISKKDVSNFKLRKGMPVGAKVTLRSDRMYEFLERFLRVALPRTRDFKGVNTKLDGRGNYNVGIKEQIMFPEIDIDKVPNITGMDITFVTTAKTDEEGFELLKNFGFPFKK